MSDSEARTILVADDDPDILELVCIRLEQAGYRTVRARDGAEAVELARANPPALCVLDVLMPKLNGFQVLRALREEETTKEVPVIILTASVHDRDVTRGLEGGADHYIRKPFNPRELLARVERLLGPG